MITTEGERMARYDPRPRWPWLALYVAAVILGTVLWLWWGSARGLSVVPLAAAVVVRLARGWTERRPAERTASAAEAQK